MSDEYDYTVNKNQIAVLFGKSIKTVGDWILHGMPTLGKHGTCVLIDLSEAIKWRETYILGSDTHKAQAEKSRLDSARADKAELEYKKLLGNLVEIDVVEKIMVNLITTTVTRLKSMPTKLAPVVRGCKTLPRIESEIRKQLYECIDDIRTFDVTCFVDEDTRSLAASSNTNVKQVVRRKSKVKSRSKR